MDNLQASVHGPYEDLAIKGLEVLEKAIDKAPAEIVGKLWEMFYQDCRDWREFWKAVKSVAG